MPLLSPSMEKVLARCCQCDVELYETDDALWDQEGGVWFCEDICLEKYIVQNAIEFIDLIKEHYFEKLSVGK